MGDTVARPAYERVLRRVTPGEHGCWLYIGALDRNGYGRVDSRFTHRVVYEEFWGPIPEGLVIDHLCRVPGCVNPEHLEAVTQRENMRRGDAPNWVTERTDICRRGHSMADALIKHNGRNCRSCHREREARYRRERTR